MNSTGFGSLHIVSKHPSNWGDDGTTTRWEKTRAMMTQGINLKLPPRPRHSGVRGIMFGVVLGLGVWIIVGATALMLWRVWG